MGRNRKSDRHLPKRMYLRSGSYYFVDVSGKWHNLGRAYVDAMLAYAKLTDTEKKPIFTVGDLLDRYLRDVALTKAQSTYQGNLKQAKYLRAGLGHIPCQDVTPVLLYQYMDARPRVSANRELALLSHAYKKGIRWGLGNYNPCTGLERNPEPERDRYVTNAEYLAFREMAGPLVAAFMDVAYVTALRLSDVLAIRLEHIQDDGLHVHVSKTDKDMVIEWAPALRQAIYNARQLRHRVGSLYLFANRKGQPYTASGFISIWDRKMAKALEKGVLSEAFTRHDLRAKAASDTSKGHAQQLLAHATEQMTNRYRRNVEKVKPLG